MAKGCVCDRYGGKTAAEEAAGKPTCSERIETLEEELQASQKRGDRAVFIAESLFQMIPKEVWRDRGVEYMGQYEGDYWAEQTREEIRALAVECSESAT